MLARPTPVPRRQVIGFSPSRRRRELRTGQRDQLAAGHRGHRCRTPRSATAAPAAACTSTPSRDGRPISAPWATVNPVCPSAASTPAARSGTRRAPPRPTRSPGPRPPPPPARTCAGAPARPGGRRRTRPARSTSPVTRGAAPPGRAPRGPPRPGAPAGTRTAPRPRPPRPAAPGPGRPRSARPPRPAPAPSRSGPSSGGPPVTCAPCASTVTGSSPAPHSCTTSPVPITRSRASTQAAPDARVPGERQLAGRGEDPQPVVGPGRGRRQRERGLGQPELGGDRLHLARRSARSPPCTTASGFPAYGAVGEHVDDVVAQAHQHIVISAARRVRRRTLS